MALLRMGARPLYRFVLSKLTNRSYREVTETKPSILSCAVVELENDMCTVKSEPKAVLDSKTTADKSSELYRHPFYEAPCIRKINDLYYLIYSSGENNELAYATSNFPDRGFQYRGYYFKQRPRLSRQQATKSSRRNDTRLDRTDKRKILCFLSPLHEQYGFLPPGLRGARNNKRRRNNKSG